MKPLVTLFAAFIMLLNCKQVSGNSFIPAFITTEENPSFKKKKKTMKRIGLFGKAISALLKGKMAKELFAQYWTGGGDYHLSDEEVTLIAGEISRLGNNYCTDSSYIPGTNPAVQRKLFNFYSSKLLVDAIGYGTAYFNGNELVGFYDDYDFNPKRWGVRPFIHELKTRMMFLIGKLKGARPFEVLYGTVPR